MTIALCTIVRNEGHVIGRMLNSIHGQIDRYVICDTGSSDDTAAVIANSHIPGELHDRPWQNFGRNRTDALQLARGNADWILVLDADETLHGRLPALDPHATSYDIELRQSGERWTSKRLLLNRLRWRYIGAAHAIPTPELPDAHPQQIPPDVAWIEHHNDGGSKAGRRERNIALLRHAVHENPTDARSWFYLANEFRWHGNTDQAIAAYRQRIQLDGWQEEQWCSHYYLGLLLPYGARELERAYELRPHRLEAHHALARLHRLDGRPRLALVWTDLAARTAATTDRLFVRQWIYDYGIRAEAILARADLGEPVEPDLSLLLDRGELGDYREPLTRLRVR